jgi:hypothetical protein
MDAIIDGAVAPEGLAGAANNEFNYEESLNKGTAVCQ